MVSHFVNIGSNPYIKDSRAMAVPVHSIDCITEYTPDWNDLWHEGDELFACVHVNGKQIPTRYSFTNMVNILNSAISN